MSWAKAFLLAVAAALLGLPARAVITTDTQPSFEAVISVPDQKMVLLEGGELRKRYQVSTSRFGVGDGCGTYKTPLGRLKICEKLGAELPAGTVIKHRQATGEVLAANAPGRDPIVSRILWLEGCEGQNANARERSIYIHGTTEEKNIGRPVSWGCIRMRSEDVIELFSELPLGAQVTIINDRLPKYPKFVPKPEPKEETLVARQTTPAAPRANAAAVVGPPSPIAAREPEKVEKRSTVAGEAKAPAFAKSADVAKLREAPRESEAETRVVAADPAPAAEPSEPAKASHVRRAVEIVSTNPVHKTGDLTQALHGSILSAGLNEGNSEVPQLRQ